MVPYNAWFKVTSLAKYFFLASQDSGQSEVNVLQAVLPIQLSIVEWLTR